MASIEPEAPRLEVLKTLGDNTRYAIYLELARASRPLSTSDIAATLDLHPNTVRPHLERMRELGLLEVDADPQGSVGRPQHRYRLAPDAPSLGLEPPAFPLLASLLAQVALTAGAGTEECAEVGRGQGRAAASRTSAASCLASLTADLESLGFDPAVAVDDDAAVVAFTHCPFRELAEAYPDLVCQLHRGIIEGFLEVAGAEGDTYVVERFNSLVDREPCQVALVAR